MTQWEQVLSMLRANPDGLTTADFCSTPGLAAEYRRAITDCRKIGRHFGFRIPPPERIRKGCFRYKLIEDKS